MAGSKWNYKAYSDVKISSDASMGNDTARYHLRLEAHAKTIMSAGIKVPPFRSAKP
ncbi:MAG: hypothetical protein ABSG92_06765 [Conexivisphaerales archaeon]